MFFKKPRRLDPRELALDIHVKGNSWPEIREKLVTAAIEFCADLPITAENVVLPERVNIRRYINTSGQPEEENFTHDAYEKVTIILS